MNKPDVPPQACVFINCDGASRGNPGMSAIGVCIKGEDGQTILAKFSECIGTATNNIAEYKAVIKVLDLASEFTNKKVMILSDSELLVRQLNRIYRIRHKNLKPLFLELKKFEALYEEVCYNHIPREQNSVADSLANNALDGVLK